MSDLKRVHNPVFSYPQAKVIVNGTVGTDAREHGCQGATRVERQRVWITTTYGFNAATRLARRFVAQTEASKI